MTVHRTALTFALAAAFAHGASAQASDVADMQLMQVKTPEESKEPWDHHAVVEPIRGEAAWTTRAESRWARWKAS
jgi:hypothetical protein